MSATASLLYPADRPIGAAPLRRPNSTKLYPPRLRPNLVERPYLVSLLNDDPDRRLTLICAPAGYGKSTLVAQWLAQLALPSAWATLEASDNDPLSFFGLIVAALHSVDRDLAVSTAALLAESRSIHADEIVEQLIWDLSSTTRSFVMVLDEYHVIDEPVIHLAMERWAQRLPATMHLVLISRTSPPLRLARLQASGELFELERADLQFTEAESLSFYQEYLGLDLKPSEVASLHERVEGWVTGLQLVGFALRGRLREQVEQFLEEVVSSADFGDRYLWEEVLEDQPEDVRSFLLRTAVLDRFTPDLCDAVTGIRNGADMIRRCERDNLFVVSLGGHAAWYRYHYLFADALRERLGRTAAEGELDDLHRRASEWLEENGYFEDAIRHAIAGHVWDRAIRLLESFCAELFDHDHVVTLRTWLHGLPPQVLESSPRLAFWLAWAQVRTGRWPGANHSLRIAEEAWTANDDRQGEGMVLLWHAVRLVNAQDSRRAIEYAQRALDCLQTDRPTERIIALLIRGIAHIFHGEPIAAEAVFADARTAIDTTGRTWLQPFEMAYSAALMAQQGKLLESTVLCRQAIKAGGDQPTEIWAQVAHFLLGQVYLEWGLLDDARRCFLRAESLAEMTQSLHWRDRIRVGLARVAWTRGATEVAFDQIEQAINFAANAGLMQDMRNARAHQARFWLASNDLALARRWADSCELDPYLPPEYERQVELLTFARLLVQEGRADLALRILQRIDQQAKAFGRYGERVEIQIVTALAHKALGASVEAFVSLNSALKLGETGGYVRIFVDEGEALASLLRHAAARAGQRDYVQRLLAEFGTTEVVGQPNQSATQDGLSDREVEVLRLVAAGLANRDVGRRLFISEKTVKTHMSNIMGKLGAANRTQAVDQARRLSLL